MPFFISIWAILLFIACSSRESGEVPVPKLSANSSSSATLQSSDSEQSASKPQPDSANQSAESPKKFPLAAKNATGSGEYFAGQKIVLSAKSPEENLCAERWEITPNRYENALARISEDSVQFTMPADSVKIHVKFRSCLANAQGTVIGNLRWMTKNVNIPANGSLCYGKKASNCKKYGRLYDFKSASGICADGWRLPTDAEWTSMIEALGANAGQKLKSESGWAKDDENSGNGTDSVHFRALPSGIVYENDFMYLGHHAYFWTATERDSSTAYYRSLSYDSPESYRYYNFKTAGYAVRCVQDVK